MRRRLITVARVIGLAVLTLVCLYLIGRALVEVVGVDRSDPASYQEDWGGPSYAGVLAVHCLPGVLAAIVLYMSLVRPRRLRRTSVRPGRPPRKGR